MSYKTILCHFADERRFGRLMTPAALLARRFDAHLTGLALVPPAIVEPQLVPGGAATVIDSHRKAAIAAAGRMRPQFEAAAREAGLSYDWSLVDADPDPVWRKVVAMGQSADLVMASVADRAWPLSQLVEGQEEIVLNVGRPVLLIPNAGTFGDVGRRVLVAWNGRREAARAAFDALPLLKTAEKVSVMWINPEKEADTSLDLPAADLCAGLARHGVRCEAVEISRPEQNPGAVILERAQSMGIDLVVMGCYGHSRLRELLLGGVTRHVLQAPPVPILMSH